MLLLLVFTPIIAALLIIAGASARRTALYASIGTLCLSLMAFLLFKAPARGFQYVTSFPISPEWHLNFTLGLDGLSLIMVLLASIVTVAAVWFTDKIDNHEHAFYACLLFISGGAIGAFASLDLFFFYAFHELALIPTFLLIGSPGELDRISLPFTTSGPLVVECWLLERSPMVVSQTTLPLRASKAIRCASLVAT